MNNDACSNEISLYFANAIDPTIIVQYYITREVETISRTGYIRSVATPNRHKSACPTRYASLLLKREPI